MSAPRHEHRSGCLTCGATLEYLASAQAMRCFLCGADVVSAARCSAGHFVCDACHAGAAKDVIERVCAATSSTDPLELARGLMRHPALKLHGPEHHFLVPAVLLAADANARLAPEEKPRLLAEAKRRSAAVPGGFCGFHGACGAGIGAGIYASVALGATPLSDRSWGLANRATARALEAIGRVGGPRCCKRTTSLALLAMVRWAREHRGVALRGHGAPCEVSSVNAECIRARCPFYPRDAAPPA